MVMVDSLLETFISIEDSLSNMVIKQSLFEPTSNHHVRDYDTFGVDSKVKLRWVGAGHEYIIHVHTDESRVDPSSGGLAVGMLADNSKHVHEKV